MSVKGNGTLGNNINFPSAVRSALSPPNSWSMKIFLCPSGGAPSQGDGFQTPYSSEGGGSGIQFFFSDSPNTQVLHWLNFNGADTVVSGGVLSATQVTAIVLTHNAGTNTSIIYRRDAGGTVTSQSIADTIGGGPWTDALFFNEGANDEPMNGEEYAIVIWSRVLSATEAANETYQCRAVTRDSLVVECPQPSSATLAIDMSGNGNSATVTGSIASSSLNMPVPFGGPGVMM